MKNNKEKLIQFIKNELYWDKNKNTDNMILVRVSFWNLGNCEIGFFILHFRSDGVNIPKRCKTTKLAENVLVTEEYERNLNKIQPQLITENEIFAWKKDKRQIFSDAAKGLDNFILDNNIKPDYWVGDGISVFMLDPKYTIGEIHKLLMHKTFLINGTEVGIDINITIIKNDDSLLGVNPIYELSVPLIKDLKYIGKGEILSIVANLYHEHIDKESFYSVLIDRDVKGSVFDVLMLDYERRFIEEKPEIIDTIKLQKELEY